MATILAGNAAPGAAPAARAPGARRWTRLAWWVLGAILLGYGLMAFQSGTRISPLLKDGPASAAKVDYIVEQSEQGADMAASPEAREVIPFWIRLIARIESSEYALGQDSIMETEHFYYSMPEQKRHVLGTHMMVGMLLMVTGFLQFVPAIRRRHRRLHRVTGIVFVVAAFVSQGMAGWHLVSTPLEDIYSQYVFYAGLWLLNFTSIGSICMAGWAILRRDFALHLGWMALAFGCFLSAPIQRALWIGLAPFSGNATFNEVNILVNVVLLPLTFLAGYALFYANRASGGLRPGAAETVGMPAWGRGALWLACLVAAVLGGVLLLGGLGMSEVTRQLAMPAAAERHDAVVSGPLAWIAAALITALVFGLARQLTQSGDALARRGRLMSGLFAGAALLAVIEIAWGWQLGMPGHAHPVAGSAWALNGVLLLVMLACAVRHAVKGAAGRLREALWFVLFLAMSPALLLVLLHVVDAIAIVPAEYAAIGQGYQLAAAAALIIPVLLGHLLAVHSPETRRYAIH